MSEEDPNKMVTCFEVGKVLATYDGYAPSKALVVARVSEMSLATVVSGLTGNGGVRTCQLPYSKETQAKLEAGDTLAQELQHLAVQQATLLEQLGQLAESGQER